MPEIPLSEVRSNRRASHQEAPAPIRLDFVNLQAEMAVFVVQRLAEIPLQNQKSRSFHLQMLAHRRLHPDFHQKVLL